MKKLLATLFQLSPFLFAFSLSAAIPQHWTVETSRVQPAQFEAYHGETIEFAAAMQTYGKPLAITNDLIGIYWQTNGMGSAYWTAPAVISNNVMIARWEPEMDVGANVYSCFIGAPGEIYRAAFQLRLRPSPGAEPSELPLPVKTLDFAQVTVLNAPYYSKSETDAKIIELAPAPGNYATVSNRAMTAVQPDAIADMETQTHAAATYVQFANSTKTAVTIGGLNTAQSTDGGGTVAIGRNTRALADSSFAGGHRAMTATGTKYSMSFGNRTFAPTGAIALGYQAWASSTGYFANDDSDIVVGLGQEHKYSFVWQGKDDSDPGYYHSHGDGTFNINPIGGISGVWIGSQSLASLLNTKQPVISDLATIRSGASLGATAVQPSTISDMETKTHAAATYQPKGSYLTFESDPTVDGKISTHNSSSSAHADIRNTVNNLADNVSTWSSYWSGDDVRVTVTNYDSAVNLPSLYLEYKLSNGTFRTVWDERTRWDINDRRMAAVESAVEGKADRAWGYYDSHTGGWAPDGYTWLSSPKIAISGGMAYQKHVTSEGAVWVLESNGLIAESGGVMSNGFFRISDDEGNPLFEIVKGDKRTVGATAGSCEPLAGYAITHLQIGYAVESADHPKIYVTRSLTPVDWKDEEDADCPATVNWSGSSGNWTAVVAGKVAEAQLFVKAEYEVGGNTYIKQSAPVSVQKLVLGGQEYRVGTATISGHTVLTLTLEP